MIFLCLVLFTMLSLDSDDFFSGFQASQTAVVLLTALFIHAATTNSCECESRWLLKSKWLSQNNVFTRCLIPFERLVTFLPVFRQRALLSNCAFLRRFLFVNGRVEFWLIVEVFDWTFQVFGAISVVFRGYAWNCDWLFYLLAEKRFRGRSWIEAAHALRRQQCFPLELKRLLLLLDHVINIVRVNYIWLWVHELLVKDFIPEEWFKLVLMV